MFWEVLRPDSVVALENKLVKKILPRYVKVVKDELPARFQIAKMVEVDETSSKDPWEIHVEAMEEFYRLMKSVDKGKTSLESLEAPRFSLLDLKVKLAEEILKACEFCERKCKVNRLNGAKGFCGVANECLISSEFMHFGEEFHVTPSHTIFFMGCTFRCVYCQNYTISQWYEKGEEITPQEMARMIEIRRMEGSRNVNFVGGEPTPYLYWILLALKECNANVPVVWNSNFYMSEKSMKLLDGVVDMYLSDFKYGNDECARRLSGVENYFEVVSRNHLLAAQQGEFTVRHLVLPNHLRCCTEKVFDWMSKNIKERCIVNVMDQYTPYWKAFEHEDINRRLEREEFELAVSMAREKGLNFIT